MTADIVGIDHVQLAMPKGGEARAREFYQDVLGLIERLARAGIAARRDEPLEGYDRVYIDDPFGNRIELMQKA